MKYEAARHFKYLRIKLRGGYQKIARVTYAKSMFEV